jgi:hypothetical protein
MAFALAGAAIAQAANEARWGLDRGSESASLFFSLRQAGSSLLGFNCGSVSTGGAAAFSAEPAYLEAEPTIGLEVVSEVSTQSGEAVRRAEMDDASIGDVKTPLRVRLRRLMVEGAEPLSWEDDGLHEVALSGASKSVADLVAACRP